MSRILLMKMKQSSKDSIETSKLFFDVYFAFLRKFKKFSCWSFMKEQFIMILSELERSKPLGDLVLTWTDFDHDKFIRIPRKRL